MSAQSHTYADPVEAPLAFAEAHENADPAEAMSSYQKILYEHTRRQLQSAANPNSRRTFGGPSSISSTSPSLTSESSNESNTSNFSVQS